MTIIKKPQIDLVLKAYIQEAGQEIEQTDRYIDQLKNHNCFKEFETANFKTQTLEMKFSIPSSTSTLFGNTCKVEDPGLNLLQATKRDSLNFNLNLSETCLQVVIDATEHFSCLLVPDTGS
jgi:hypothetical protein